VRECDDADVLFIVAADRKATVPSITHTHTHSDTDLTPMLLLCHCTLLATIISKLVGTNNLLSRTVAADSDHAIYRPLSLYLYVYMHVIYIHLTETLLEMVTRWQSTKATEHVYSGSCAYTPSIHDLHDIRRQLLFIFVPSHALSRVF
jgi:hypothetical protein